MPRQSLRSRRMTPKAACYQKSRAAGHRVIVANSRKATEAACRAPKAVSLHSRRRGLPLRYKTPQHKPASKPAGKSNSKTAGKTADNPANKAASCATSQCKDITIIPVAQPPSQALHVDPLPGQPQSQPRSRPQLQPEIEPSGCDIDTVYRALEGMLDIGGDAMSGIAVCDPAASDADYCAAMYDLASICDFAVADDEVVGDHVVVPSTPAIAPVDITATLQCIYNVRTILESYNSDPIAAAERWRQIENVVSWAIGEKMLQWLECETRV